MKRILAFLMVMLLLALAACAPAPTGDTVQDAQQGETETLENPIAETPPNPEEDYTAFYEYLLAIQSAGKIPFKDKLEAKGEVSGEFSLTIGGKTFDNAAAAELTVYTAEFELFTKVEGHDTAWVGYRFTEVCELLGLELDESVKLHATDGFSQVFDVKNIDDNTMIAIIKDGEAADGPYFAPCTFLISANYTKFLSAIDIL